MGKSSSLVDRAEALLEALAVCESPDDFAMILVTRVFAREHLRMTWMFRNDGSTDLIRIGAYGDRHILDLPPRVSIWSNLALTQAFRADRVVRVNDAETYRLVYGDIPARLDGKGFLSFPLHERGKTVGTMSLIFGEPLHENPISDDEIRLLQLAAERVMHDWRRIAETQTDVLSSRSREFTERQVRLLTELDSGKTLREVAVSWNLSEATIKSDAQKIYRSLGVNKKGDALRVARQLGFIPSVDG